MAGIQTKDEPLFTLPILGKNVYKFWDNNIPAICRDLHKSVPSSRYLIITDDNVARILLPRVEKCLHQQGMNYLTKVIPAGETSKSRAVKEQIEDWMLSHKCSRDSCLVALGGGVVGDLCGYVAATYMRGIQFVQLPSTLLAMVDSSIGGKTGVDTPHGKNLIGAFHQPSMVYVNLNFLETLPLRELRNGIAEIIKIAVCWDHSMFCRLEASFQQILIQKDFQVLTSLILDSAKLKAMVVSIDEKDAGLRSLLNFGHSIGHAVEALCAESHGMLHGEAVAIGLVKEAEVARSLGHLSQANLARLVRCIRNYQLPHQLPSNVLTESIFEKMGIDKKNIGSEKAIVILTRIGQTLEKKATLVSDSVLQRVLTDKVVVIPPGCGVSGSLSVPGSKSISNRAILMAALGKGSCVLSGILHSDDTEAMTSALKSLGVSIDQVFENSQNFPENSICVVGSEGNLCLPTLPLYLGNSGTSMRFLCASICLITGKVGSVILTGDERMQQRPIAPLVDALRRCGVTIRYTGKVGCPPLEIQIGPKCHLGGEISLLADISSQYVSSLLICGPYGSQEMKLRLSGSSIVSENYIEMTHNLMSFFGISVSKQESPLIYSIPQGVYSNPAHFCIEGDASSATYPLAIAAITGGTVTVGNVGSSSLQGDARFCRVLETMGCVVSQTEISTTVSGRKLRAVNIDMSSMTDAFMTLAVVASVAKGTTKITNIANQRVKECDRIAAMVGNLTKLGVPAKELQDGLEITGISLKEFATQNGKPVFIDCYNDHRIAMSFALLGCVVPNIIIQEKSCVDKTYPEFWDHLHNSLGLQIEAHSEKYAARDSLGNIVPAHLPLDRVSIESIILIGMRGVGKTSLGSYASKALGLDFIDVDVYLESKIGMSLKEFIESEGWDFFREKEYEAFLEVVTKYPKNHVIACGGGIVENRRSRDLLLNHRNIVYVKKDFQDLQRDLSTQKHRPFFAEDLEAVFSRRSSWYLHCSKYAFCIRSGDTDYGAITKDFCRLLDFMKNGSPWVSQAHPSYFLSLTVPNVHNAIAIGIEQLCIGVHAIELRVDLLESWEPVFIEDQISLLRRHVSLPLIYTLRSCHQGGNFSGQEEEYFSLLRLGLRTGCEYVDMESVWSLASRETFLSQKGPCRVIASYHVSHSENEGSIADLRSWFDICFHQGRADLVKIVGYCRKFIDNHALHTMVNQIRLLWQKPEGDFPCIAILMGPLGGLSRAMNRYLTPVSHPLLSTKAAPGQLSLFEIHELQSKLGLLPKQSFYLFGSPISHSPSPLMHNAAFQELRLPHHYTLLETADTTACSSLLSSEEFGGANVTIPLKTLIIPHLDELSAAAQKIGAVNCISKFQGKIVGHNTDWIGLFNPIRDLAQSLGRGLPSSGLVIGAGGTARSACFCLLQLGVRDLWIYNRTLSKAEALAADFHANLITDLDRISLVDVVISTVPVSAKCLLPLSVLSLKPIVFDVVYLPRKTPLLLQAEAHHCPTLSGSAMLIEQGVESFKIWTGLNPPRYLMEDAVMAHCEEVEKKMAK